MGPRIYAGIVALLTLLTAACAEPQRQGAETVTDDLGRSIGVPMPALRVATLAPNLTEIVYSVGAGDRLVGAGAPDNHPRAVDTLPRYSTYPVDFEALAALQPDLVLATTQINTPRTAETLEAIGIPTYFLSFSGLDDVFDGMETVGHLLGTAVAARAAVDSLREQAAELRRITARVEEPPSVLFLIGPETLYSFGGPSYIHEVIELAGGRSITQDLPAAAPVLSEEYVLSEGPDVIVGPWSSETGTSDLLENHPTWGVVPAVRDGRVYGVEADLVARPGPRLVAGARALAKHLHPALFAAATTDSN
jgi:iron complex transport system substrate-binding protein